MEYIPMRLTIDGKSFDLPDEPMRRLANVAHYQLEKIKEREGRQFPALDQEATACAIEIMFRINEAQMGK